MSFRSETLLAATVAFVLSGCVAVNADAAERKNTPQFRHPAAVVAVDKWLFTANERSGSISVVDTNEMRVVDEVEVGGRLADLAATPHGETLFACNQQHHQLVVLLRNDHRLTVTQRVPLPHSPVSVVVSSDGGFVSVASLWSRQICLAAIEGANDSAPINVSVRKVLDLPFAPRKQFLSQDGDRLVAADAFGEHLAVIDTREAQLLSLRTLGGHNIGGMAASHDGRELLITHQLLNGRVATIRQRVFWGAVIGNVVKSIHFDELLAIAEASEATAVRPRAIAHWSLLPLGEPGRAAGDPGEIVITNEGAEVIVLSGVNEVAIRKAPRQPLVRCKVGQRPCGIALAPDQRRAFVANKFDDSVSVIDIAAQSITSTLSLGPQPEAAAADLGEQLFYDATLSLDGWYSCHSCHTDGHTCGLRNDNLGDESYGAPKSIPSLLGVGETGPWAWNGQQTDLRSQIHKSVTVTMQGKELPSDDPRLDALAAYLQSLSPPPALDLARTTRDDVQIERGQNVFGRTGCTECHREPTYTTPRAYDVGLRDELDSRNFNPPSLRGLSQRETYFHDGRATELRQVFEQFEHGGAGTLSPSELTDLLAFLRSL
jgi:YVTN family beta-propeller protein